MPVPFLTCVLSKRTVHLLLWLLWGAAIAQLGWADNDAHSLALLLYGPSVMLAGRASSAYALALGYFAWLGIDEVGAVQAYYGWSAAASVGVWAVHAAVNALPWAIGYVAAKLPCRCWRGLSEWVVVAVAWLLAAGLSLVEPWASLGWGNPLFVAGVELPGSGALGVVLVALLQVLLGWLVWYAWHTRRFVAPLVAALACLMVFGSSWRLYREPVQRVHDVLWHPMQTSFGQAAAVADLVARLRWLKELVDQALQESDFHGAVVVLPESVLGPYRPSIESVFLLRRSALKRQEVAFLLHVDLACPKQASWCARPQNDARIDLRGTVWLYDSDGSQMLYVARREVSRPSLVLGWGRRESELSTPVRRTRWGRLAFGVCYEGFLLRHWMDVAMSDVGPDVVVGFANLWFDRANDRLARKQRLAFERGALLVGAPLVLAVNR